MAERDKGRLRCGFTTGTAAAAATKAALMFLVSGRKPTKVRVALLNGDDLEIQVHTCRRINSDTTVATVIKDAGDDPDITNRAEIGAQVTWNVGPMASQITIRGGRGVGMVTKPGLKVPPGEAAITPGPCKMIRFAVKQVLHRHGLIGHLDTKIFVPQGEVMARRTLNARLGIIGGISILGTTGVVRPLSHKAYTATIRAAFSVARAAGLKRIVLTTGRRSERFAQRHWPHIPKEGYVQIGDYFAESMLMAAEFEFDRVVLAIFFGKAVKMALGIAHTHARSARLSLQSLARWTENITGDAELSTAVAGANTARQAFDLLKDDYPAVVEKVGRKVLEAATTFGDGRVSVDAVIFGFDGSARFSSKHDTGAYSGQH
jgi:cobalt-precorrin-5B (C1)-methyltransferase